MCVIVDIDNILTKIPYIKYPDQTPSSPDPYVLWWIATNRYDLSAEQIAAAYKLRWDIENFFGWWKRHLKVYYLIARSEHGLMVQILAGLITYLRLAIYCYEQHNEKVSIKRVRQLRIKIQNELRGSCCNAESLSDFKERNTWHSYAKT